MTEVKSLMGVSVMITTSVYTSRTTEHSSTQHTQGRLNRTLLNTPEHSSTHHNTPQHTRTLLNTTHPRQVKQNTPQPTNTPKASQTEHSSTHQNTPQHTNTPSSTSRQDTRTEPIIYKTPLDSTTPKWMDPKPKS
ncbi:hypothetical protein Pmani_022081 [Petrolisthes manimaculis]|uniref:Uncharacterized protein n=1 Tax=Petrolisthes manimaculis TaxID=1843537 RepID=A0AAE1PCG8_9EUCA|nr:hypothetical protein Pmani_022081 [Petrolisthes manimaculis]